MYKQWSSIRNTIWIPADASCILFPQEIYFKNSASVNISLSSNALSLHHHFLWSVYISMPGQKYTVVCLIQIRRIYAYSSEQEADSSWMTFPANEQLSLNYTHLSYFSYCRKLLLPCGNLLLICCSTGKGMILKIKSQSRDTNSPYHIDLTAISKEGEF